MSVSASRIEGGFNVARFHFQSASPAGVARRRLFHSPSIKLRICKRYALQKNEELINVLSLAMQTQNRRKTFCYSWKEIFLYLGKNLCSEINRELKMTQLN